MPPNTGPERLARRRLESQPGSRRRCHRRDFRSRCLSRPRFALSPTVCRRPAPIAPTRRPHLAHRLCLRPIPHRRPPLVHRRPHHREPLRRTLRHRNPRRASRGGKPPLPGRGGPRNGRTLLLANTQRLTPTQDCTSESGIGPERALEAITITPRAQRESSSSPEPPQRAEARSRGAHTHAPATAVLLQALNNSPDSAHQRLTQRVFIEVETRADPLLETTKNNKQTHL